MQPRDLPQARWRKSSHSGNDDLCVETAFLPDGRIAVRHSKDPHGAILIYTPAEWDAFIKGAKDGQFDLPWAGLGRRGGAGFDDRVAGQFGGMASM